MSLAEEVITKLAAPLDPTRVKKREGGGGRSLSYLEGHDVIRTANVVFGPGEWSYLVETLDCLGEEPVIKTYNGQTREGFRVAYRAIVEVRVGDVAFSDVGFGDAMEYTGSKLTPHELASKEAVTDGLKRALKNFGDQFGLVLYDKDAPEHNGRNASAPGTGATQTIASSAGDVGVPGGRAAVTEPHPSASPAAPTSGDPSDYIFETGKHAGKALKDVPLDYLSWYQDKGPKADVKERIAQFLGGGSFEEPDDDGIPFRSSIDGLGG